MMKFTVAALMFLICTAALLSTTKGQPRIQLRCQCIQTYSGKPISIGRILSLKVIPAGPQCKYEEIIATLKKGQMCLNAEYKWVISLKQKINEREVNSQNNTLPSGSLV